MARDIKAHFYWFGPVEGKSDPVVEAIDNFGKRPAPFEFSHSGRDFLGSTFHWDPNKGILSGTVFLLRGSGLPMTVRGSKANPISLAPDEQLGEPMCFAYCPSESAALVHYSHTGARSSSLHAVISHVGFPYAMQMEPLIRAGMLEKLQSLQIAKKLEFKLTDPKAIAELRNFGGAVGDSIDVADKLGAVVVHVEVSMGHSKEGLKLAAAKSVAGRLARIATEAPDGEAPVATVKITGADAEEGHLEQLDLLRAREFVELNVEEEGRHMSQKHCQRQLSKALQDNLHLFRRQVSER